MSERAQLIDMFCGADIIFNEPHWGMLEVETLGGVVQFMFDDKEQLERIDITD